MTDRIISSMPIRSCPYMTGPDQIIVLDGVFVVSQELLTRMLAASPDELKELVGKATIIDLGRYEPFKTVIQKPEWPTRLSFKHQIF